MHPTVSTALIVDKGTRNIKNSEAYHLGLVELQDASSQASVLQLSTDQNGPILDFCAGGGGKSLALSAYLNKPIFAYDQKINELNALKEEISEKAENKNQLAIYNEKTAASLYSATNRMSKHSLAEQTKYANTNALADIKNTVTEASLSVDDFNLGQDSEYVKNPSAGRNLNRVGTYLGI